MKIFLPITYCLLLAGCLSALESSNGSPLQEALSVKADELLEAGLYSQAVSAYEEILKTLPLQEEGSNDAPLLLFAMQSRLHLAQAQFALENYREAIHLLNENISLSSGSNPQHKEIQVDSHYLISLAYKAQGKYFDAEQGLQTYLNQASPATARFFEEAQFERGHVLFLLGNYEEAGSHFKKVKENPKFRLYALSQLYLARIELCKGHAADAAAILSTLAPHLPQDDALIFELYYLKGEAGMQMCHYTQAAEYFENALPKHLTAKCSWYAATLYQLGWCYLKIGDNDLSGRKEQEESFKKSEDAFKQLLIVAPSEKAYLALGQCYLAKANRLKLKEAYASAENLLSNQEIFVSKEAQAHALLLRAAAAPSYEDRDKFYRQLTDDSNSSSSFFARGWFMRAMNDFEHGMDLFQSGRQEESKPAFGQSSNFFRIAFHLLCQTDKTHAGEALKYQALAVSYLGKAHSYYEACLLLDDLMHNYHGFWQAMEAPDEILYLHGMFAARLSEEEGKHQEYIEIAGRSLKEAALFPNGTFGDISLLHLGTWHYRQERYEAAEEAYLNLTDKFPHSPFCGEAWFWSACCADQLHKDPKVSKQRRRYAFDHFPQSSYAAEAYFTFYTYQDYLQGDRNAIKHLQNFAEKYPKTPFLIEAYYLLGLDHKRDRKTPEGKWISKKNLTNAIDAFQEAETLFDAFIEKGIISSEKLEYYLSIRYRAIFERALANLAIAEEAQGAKRQIYLEYAEEVFKNLVEEFKKADGPYMKQQHENTTFPKTYEESAFWLAQTYLKAKNDDEAEKVLSELLECYQKSKISNGYYLSRVWFEQGNIAMKRQDHRLAKQYFKHAEEAAKGNVLGTEQKLDLWIQQSLCHRELAEYESAILILSRVINDDAISSLRLKAMYLRAEAYELLGRPELARKQLESMVKKGGTWALKAKEKLDKDYGY